MTVPTSPAAAEAKAIGVPAPTIGLHRLYRINCGDNRGKGGVGNPPATGKAGQEAIAVADPEHVVQRGARGAELDAEARRRVEIPAEIRRRLAPRSGLLCHLRI